MKIVSFLVRPFSASANKKRKASKKPIWKWKYSKLSAHMYTWVYFCHHFLFSPYFFFCFVCLRVASREKFAAICPKTFFIGDSFDCSVGQEKKELWRGGGGGSYVWVFRFSTRNAGNLPCLPPSTTPLFFIAISSAHFFTIFSLFFFAGWLTTIRLADFLLPSTFISLCRRRVACNMHCTK